MNKFLTFLTYYCSRSGKFIILFGLSLGMSGCVSPSGTENRDEITIGVALSTDKDVYHLTLLQEIFREVELTWNLNIKLMVRVSDNNPVKQIDDLERLILKDVDLFIISPPNQQKDTLSGILNEIYQKGIPVIVMREDIPGARYPYFIGADHQKLGKIASAKFKEFSDVPLEIWEIGEPSLPNISSRIHTSLNSSLIHTPCHLHYTVKHPDSIVNWFRFSLKNLKKAPDVIFTHNNKSGIIAETFFKQRSENPAIISINGLQDDIGLKALKDSIFYGIFQYPTGGDLAVQTALNYFKSPSKQVVTTQKILQPPLFIDRNNAQFAYFLNQKSKNQLKKFDTQIGQMNVREEQMNQQKLYLLISLTTVILFLVIIILISRIFIIREKNNKQLEQKNQLIMQQVKKIGEQKQKLIETVKISEQNNEDRFNFFTNISHEFRTNLSFLYYTVKALLGESKVDKKTWQRIRIIEKNTRQLLDLTNELLEFRKVESNHYRLKIKAVRMQPFIGDIMANFKEMARAKGLMLVSDVADFEIYSDVDILKKIFNNIVSNAIKYAELKSELTISGKTENGFASFIVSNTTKNVSKEELSLNFDRFYQGKNTRDKMGTGIGLAYTKELIQFLGGYISMSIENEEQVKVAFRMPLKNIKEFSHQKLEQNVSTQLPMRKSNETVLIAEDNEEMRHILIKIVSGYFNVMEAENGKEALEKVKHNNVDLVICDLLMPEMDGFEFTETMKSDSETASIPVVLLTALSTHHAVISGLGAGADAYLTKPVNEAVLISQISNLLKLKNNAALFFKKFALLPALELQSDKDEKFIAELIDIIERHLDDPTFTVETLAIACKMSPSTFYREIKQISGISGVDMIQRVRLKKAVELMDNSALNLSEVAAAVGFSDPKYFSKVFKKFFGKSPSDFRKNAEENLLNGFLQKNKAEGFIPSA